MSVNPTLLARLHAHARRASVAADEALQFGEPGATGDLLREIDTVLLLSKQATGEELTDLERRHLAEHRMSVPTDADRP